MTPDETVPPGRVGPWGIHRLESGASRRIPLGSLVLHVQEAAGEVRVAHHRATLDDPGDEADPASAPEPGPLDWSRWATARWDRRFALTPTFPDRPVVVEPEAPFHLLEGAEARIYVRVPLWAKVESVTDRGHVTLTKLPSLEASDTWWGTVEDGELCYWLSSHARRVVTSDLFRPHLAMCPLHLVNRSDSSLPVEKIALRVDYLSLYHSEGQIWSDETRVRYHGETEGSRLETTGRPPEELPGAELLAGPRLTMARGFRARTFHRLRTSFSGWM